ncbi:MAG: hypothetical protein MUF53_06265 [Gemmatimonadaceae bacterium]|nr:hypothetical protein [Gemmatimonadaceae bacterium]
MGRLVCLGAPPALETALTAWFKAGALDVPCDLTWRITVEDDPWFDAPGAGAFWQGDVGLVPHPDGTLRIAHPAGIDITVDAVTPSARWRVAADALAPLVEEVETLAMLALVFSLRRVGWHHVHAATVVAPDGTGWLLTGPSGSGKSTTVAALGSAGWQVGGDDAAFLRASADGASVVVHPWHGAVGLRPGGRQVLGIADDPAFPQRGKDRRAPDRHGFALAPPFTPAVVAACRVGGATTTLSPFPPADALALLVTQSAWVTLEPALATPHLALLERVVRRASIVQLMVAPDVVGDPHRLLRLPGT